jgi:tRNA(fMet)-specific endonuclease VapC
VAQTATESLILDTDHFSLLLHDRLAAATLLRRLRDVTRPAVTTVVTMEEQSRGWLAQIKKFNDEPPRLIEAYREFQLVFDIGEQWTILPWTPEASSVFARLRVTRPRIGTADLRIAAITISVSGTLLSRNLKDFARVPGLRVENWLD